MKVWVSCVKNQPTIFFSTSVPLPLSSQTCPHSSSFTHASFLASHLSVFDDIDYGSKDFYFQFPLLLDETIWWSRLSGFVFLQWCLVYGGLDNRSITQLLWLLVVVDCCGSQSCLWCFLVSSCCGCYWCPFLVILVMSPFHMVIGFLYGVFLWRFSLWPFQQFIFFL